MKFHYFPKDKEMQHKWIDLCSRETPLNTKYARICSLHFEPTAYKRHLMYELLDLPFPKHLCVLKNDVFSTLNLPTLQGKPKI